MSLRAVRSPDAPKMTRHAGSGVRARRRPSRSGLLRVTVTAVSAWRARVTRRVGSSRARVEPAMREDAVEQGRPGEFRASEDPEPRQDPRPPGREDRKSTRLNSSHVRISYAVFCLKKKKNEQGLQRERRHNNRLAVT